MKITKYVLVALCVIAIIAIIGCASKPRVTIVELENKGTSMGVSTPDWIKSYTTSGISKVQAQSEFRDKYCIIGEESGVNRQFVLAWADNFSAQQRIGAMLRTTIVSEYQARVQGLATSVGGAGAPAPTGTYQQEIDSVINAVVNVSYSGAQREADWWSLRRRYDPDNKEIFNDEYTAYVLYTIPKSELNNQIARALETSVRADSALYDITIQIARDMLTKGMEFVGAGDLPPPATPTQTPAEVKAASASGPTGNVIIRNNSSDTSSVMSAVRIHSGYQIGSTPIIVYENPVLGGQQASWDLPEGVYTVEVFLNNSDESIRAGLTGGGSATVGIIMGGVFAADFSEGRLSSFTRR